MKNALRVGFVLALAVVGVETEGCSSACIRHTDCNSGEQCVSGTCIVVTTPDGAASVDAMTPAASSSTTPASTTTAPPATAGAPSTWPDAGSFGTVVKDASLDTSTTF